MIDLDFKVALLVTRLNAEWNYIDRLLPAAIAWAQSVEHEILATGYPLPESWFLAAKYVGVKYPERIRMRSYEELPVPPDVPIAEEYSFWSAIFGKKTETSPLGDLDALKPLAQTTGYGIAIANRALRAWYGFNYRQILCHEMVHVGQFERSGSLAEFLTLVAWNRTQYGYNGSPLEVESHELGEACALRWCEITGDAR